MKRNLLLRIGVLVLAVGITYSLMAIPSPKKQDKRITLSLSQPEVELVLKALGELPLKETANLYFTIQQQAQAQLAPVIEQKQKDSSTSKNKKQ